MMRPVLYFLFIISSCLCSFKINATNCAELFRKSMNGGRINHMKSWFLCPLNRDLETWLLWHDDPQNFSLSEIFPIIKKHPDWPIQHHVFRYLEKLAKKESAYTAWQFFSYKRPISSKGWFYYLKLCQKMQKPWPVSWNMALLTDKQWLYFMQFSALRHYGQKKAWLCANKRHMKKNIPLLEALTPFTPPKDQHMLKLAISLSRQHGKAFEIWQQKSAAEKRAYPWLAYHAILYCLKKGKISYAIQELRTIFKVWSHELSWRVHRALAVELIHTQSYRSALSLMQRFSYPENTPEEAYRMFFIGWLQWQYCHLKMQAYRTFLTCKKIAPDANHEAQAYYWLGRVCSGLGRKEEAQQYWKKAQNYGFCFYGQMTPFAPRIRFSSIATPKSADEKFVQQEWMQCVYRLKQLSRPLSQHWVEAFFTKNSTQSLSTARHILKHAKGYAKIQASYEKLFFSAINKRKATTLPAEVYPMISLPSYIPLNRQPLVFAIMHTESLFQENIQGIADDLGLMQIRPQSARDLKHIFPHCQTDPAILKKSCNIQLGWHILCEAIKSFHHLPLAIAAYNAGADNVRKWLKHHPLPNPKNVSKQALQNALVDWIEAIPFPTTRHYVKSVLRKYYIYCTLMRQSPL